MYRGSVCVRAAGDYHGDVGEGAAVEESHGERGGRGDGLFITFLKTPVARNHRVGKAGEGVSDRVSRIDGRVALEGNVDRAQT